jgi:glycosyltransferase involved in cell wall biosynthesis
MSEIKSDISVIITCYSEGSLLFEAVNSVLEQTMPAREILVANDGSTHQPTIEACQELEKNDRIQIIWRSTNGGPSCARNDGFQAAQSEVLVLLDADDILPANALELIWQAFQSHPDAGFVYGSYLRQNEKNTEPILVNPGDISLREMLKAKPWSLSTNWRLIGTTPFRRSLWQTIGGYDPEFGVADLHDVEFWLRAIASGCPYFAIEEPIYIWRKYLGSTSRKVTPLAWYRIAQKHFQIYQSVGLEYRAYELLLLGSKWLGNQAEINEYSQRLFQHLKIGEMHFSSLLAFFLPMKVVHNLAERKRQKR